VRWRGLRSARIISAWAVFARSQDEWGAPFILPCTPTSHPWCCVRADFAAGITYAALHDALKAEGFVIYAEQGHLSKPVPHIHHG